MLAPDSLNISVVVASARPKWLANCLSQYRAQSHGGLRTEVVVVAEGDESSFRPVVDHFGADRVECHPIQGKAGAYAKDLGLSLARGRYVCFWDDDNIYYPHALATLYAAAHDHDIGIACTGHMRIDFRAIPQTPELFFTNVDSMCFAVRRSLATGARWSDHEGPGTDYAFLAKLMATSPSVRFVPVRIGEKLEGRC